MSAAILLYRPMPRPNQGVTNEQFSLLTKTIILMSLRRHYELLVGGTPSLSTNYMGDTCNWDGVMENVKN
jgi:hypothetical protein